MYKTDIIQAGRKFSIAVTGGGTGVLPMLLDGGGMSKVFMGAEVPYSESSLNDITDYKHFNDKAVSKCVAETLASFVWDKYVADFGVGVTASLFTEGQREDRINQAYLSIVSVEEDFENHLLFNKPMTRSLQEHITSCFILANIQFFVSKRTDEGLVEHLGYFADTSKLNPDFLKAINEKN